MASQNDKTIIWARVIKQKSNNIAQINNNDNDEQVQSPIATCQAITPSTPSISDHRHLAGLSPSDLQFKLEHNMHGIDDSMGMDRNINHGGDINDASIQRR